MAKHIAIQRPNDLITIVRSGLESATDNPLTEHEEIINEQYKRIKELEGKPIKDCSTCKYRLNNPYIEPCSFCLDEGDNSRHLFKDNLCTCKKPTQVLNWRGKHECCTCNKPVKS